MSLTIDNVIGIACLKSIKAIFHELHNDNKNSKYQAKCNKYILMNMFSMILKGMFI